MPDARPVLGKWPGHFGPSCGTLGGARHFLLSVRPQCPETPSRHLDGELRVSLSRGRLTRWTRSGFSDGELLCSSLAQAEAGFFLKKQEKDFD